MEHTIRRGKFRGLPPYQETRVSVLLEIRPFGRHISFLEHNSGTQQDLVEYHPPLDAG